MTDTRVVTELDFRMPELRDAKVEDYEFREDGKLVRKDRWKSAVFSICGLVGVSLRAFEITDVVDAVQTLAKDTQNWSSINDAAEDLPLTSLVDVRLTDGSILMGANYSRDKKNSKTSWSWRTLDVSAGVQSWRLATG